MTENFVIYCPYLDRDILKAVPNPRILTRERTERGEDGCLQCHQAIIRWAKERRVPRVFVMEDDCSVDRPPLNADYRLYDSVPDLIEKVRYFVAHDREREAIAVAGYERTLRDHTCERRLQSVFADMGVLCSSSRVS